MGHLVPVELEVLLNRSSARDMTGFWILLKHSPPSSSNSSVIPSLSNV